MKIWTTYFANIKKLPGNILPVSIAGWPPKGWKGAQYKVLAPKWEFFKKYKETGDKEYYISEFKSQVLSNLSQEKVISDLENILKSTEYDEIALVCYEKPGDFCHRHIVANWLNEIIDEKIKVSEILSSN